MLVDTSVWIDHFQRGNEVLAERLAAADVWVHAFVTGELACGRLTRRGEILALLQALPQAPLIEHREVLAFVETSGFPGRGIGWIDAHLLASARLARIPLWTLDRRLAAVAGRLGLAGASR